MRKSSARRETKETSVEVEISLDGSGKSKASTGLKFLDHMINTLAFHSAMDISVKARGDLRHHLAEDVALTLGECFQKALGERTGIRRFGDAIVPMEDSLAYAGIDLAKRPYSKVDLKIADGVEDMPTEDIYHIFRSFATASNATIHVMVQYGENDHHKVEAAFKALALALREAIIPDPKRKGPPSSKGKI